MEYTKLLDRWKTHFSHDPQMLSEFKAISENKDEIISRFSSDLEFGTAGLRGVMGIGTNRFNIYTVRKATQGLADYLNSTYSPASVVVSFDSRINSDVFAKETAAVLAANGITAYISKQLAPTPFLSFSVRELHCSAGVMITASHNPSEYNGYKCYGSDGSQMPPKITEQVYKHINKVDIFDDVRLSDFDKELEKGTISLIPKSVYSKYIRNVLKQSINKQYPAKCELSVTYTPLNGAGKDFVIEVLQKVGVKQLHIVKEQENPDGNFPTCKYPNPEAKEAFSLAIKTAKKNSSDIIIATDPDSDRLGVGVFYQGEYHILTGNQIGILLFNYILSQKRHKNILPDSALAIRTLVSSKMIDAIAKEYKCDIVSVPTGFKNVGQKIYELEIKNSLESFAFGFEESNGYLTGAYTRDKDAVSAALLICEICSFYKEKNLSLIDVLNNLYKKYGFYLENTVCMEFSKQSQKQKMLSIMSNLRNSHYGLIGKKKILRINDYLGSQTFDTDTNTVYELNFPKLDILEFILSGNNSIIIRPSGTEPKLKIYFMGVADNALDAKSTLLEIQSDFCSKIKNLS